MVEPVLQLIPDTWVVSRVTASFGEITELRRGLAEALATVGLVKPEKLFHNEDMLSVVICKRFQVV